MIMHFYRFLKFSSVYRASNFYKKNNKKPTNISFCMKNVGNKEAFSITLSNDCAKIHNSESILQQPKQWSYFVNRKFGFNFRSLSKGVTVLRAPSIICESHGFSEMAITTEDPCHGRRWNDKEILIATALNAMQRSTFMALYLCTAGDVSIHLIDVDSHSVGWHNVGYICPLL